MGDNLTDPPKILLLSPALHPFGGTEKIFWEDLHELSGLKPSVLVPSSQRRYRSDLPLRTVPLGPSRLPFSFELWLISATLYLQWKGRSYPIRYSPGMNAFFTTHITLHCSFRWIMEILRSLPFPMGVLPRDLRLRRLALLESLFYRLRPPRVLCLSRISERKLKEYNPEVDTFLLPPPRELFPSELPPSFPSPAEVRKALGIPPDAKVILCVGNDFRIKGQDLFLKVLSALEGEGVIGVLIGNESPQRISTWGRVKIPGNLRWRRRFQPIESLYRAVDLLLHPSRGEVLGLPPLEAYALGTPVLVSSYAGSSEFLPPDCLLPSLDLEPLIETVRTRLKEGKGHPTSHLHLPTRIERSAHFKEWLLSSKGGEP